MQIEKRSGSKQRPTIISYYLAEIAVFINTITVMAIKNNVKDLPLLTLIFTNHNLNNIAMCYSARLKKGKKEKEAEVDEEQGKRRRTRRRRDRKKFQVYT